MSIISNWTNPFANKIDNGVAGELNLRKQYLSAVSRTELASNTLQASTRIATDQLFSPQVGSNNLKPKTHEALEWVYQKVAYARIQPILLKKECAGEGGPAKTRTSTASTPIEPDLPAPLPGVRQITAPLAPPDVTFWTKTPEDKVQLAINNLPASFIVLNEKAKADELKKNVYFVALSEAEQELFYKKYFNIVGNSYSDKRINTIINYARGNAALLPSAANISIALVRQTPPPLVIKKEPAPFFISSTQFKDSTNGESGVIENYGEKLYSVPQLERDETGIPLRDDQNRLKYTFTNSPYRPTVRNGDPSAVLMSVNIINEGVVGSVLRAKLSLKVFTKEALNVIDKWLLRPGNEVNIEWGWSVGNKATNNEFLNAVIFNFSCEYAQDNTWDITVDAIAKGSLVSGVSFEIQDNNFDSIGSSAAYDASKLATIVPNLQGVIELELQSLNLGNGTVSLTPLESKQLLSSETSAILFQSKAFPHGIAQFKMPVSEVEDSAVTTAGQVGTAVGGIAGGIGAGFASPTPAAITIGFSAGALVGKPLFEAVARLFVEADYAINGVAYICLADIVHFYNNVLTQYFPRDLQTFEIQVENSPTSYDPNLVSSDPSRIMFSDNKHSSFNIGMSTYGQSNRAISNYDFPHITKFYTGTGGPMDSWQDCVNNHGDTHPELNITAGNLGHIWISVETIKSIFLTHKINTAVDPRFRNIFAFFEEIFKLITNATGGAIKPTFVQQNVYGNKKMSSQDIRSIIWIVDTNFMSNGMPGASGQVETPYLFQVNNVHSTLVRNVNARLKLPSSMQSTAYTFGRAGMNENVQSIDDLPENCISTDNGIKSVNDNKALTFNALQRLSTAKELCQFSTYDSAVMQTLQGALYGYVGSPTKYTKTGGTGVSQGWLFSRLYPAELSFELDGIAGIKYGNIINVKDALPDRYLDKIYFTVSKIEHSVANNDWKLNVTAIARIKNSEINIGYPLGENEIQQALKPNTSMQPAPQDPVSPIAPNPTGAPEIYTGGFIK